MGEYKQTPQEIRAQKGYDTVPSQEGTEVVLDFEKDPELIALDKYSQKISGMIEAKDDKALSTEIKTLKLDVKPSDLYSKDLDVQEKAAAILFTRKIEVQLDTKTPIEVITPEKMLLECEVMLLTAQSGLAELNEEPEKARKFEEAAFEKFTKRSKLMGDPKKIEKPTEMEENLWCRHTAPIMSVMLDNIGIDNFVAAGFAVNGGGNSIGGHATVVTSNSNYIDPVNGVRFCFGNSEDVYADERTDEQKELGVLEDIITYQSNIKGEEKLSFERVFSNTNIDFTYYHYMMENDNIDQGKEHYKEYVETRIKDLESEKAELTASTFMDTEKGKTLKDVVQKGEEKTDGEFVPEEAPQNPEKAATTESIAK